MELYAFDIQGFVPYAHDLVDLTFRILCPGNDFQAMKNEGR